MPLSEPDPAVPAARCVELTKVYGEGDTRVTALDRVTVTFPAGRFTAIMGPSGSGKSTLMHCMAGLDTATSGAIYIGETDLTTLDDKRLTRLRRDAVGFVFQAYNLLPMLTAIENITLPMDIAGRKPDPEWLRTVVATVGLGDRLKHRPSELSGGQQQRVACARALASRPKIIFADEPTGNLDSRSGAEVLAFLRRSVAEMISVFGALLGLAVGVVFGAALVRALKDDGISTLVIPVGQLALYVVLAGVVGVLAAVLPARRAAKLNVLRAVAST